LFDTDNNVVTEYEIEGDKVATDSDSLSLLYVHSVDDPRAFPPLFARAVSMMLAYKIAIEYKQSRALQQDAFAAAMMALQRASQVDQSTTTDKADAAMWENIF